MFVSEELKNSTEDDEKKVADAESAEAKATLDQWSRTYGSYGVHKPAHFVGSITEIMKKLPPGLQISRVGDHYYK